jgi:hypothetical protein
MRRAAGLVLAAGAASLLAGRAVAAPAVALLAPASSPLAGELRRELEAAAIAVTVVDSADQDWRRAALNLPAAGPPAGIVVTDGDHLVLVFTRGAERDALALRRLLRVDPRDALARRRACLAVVEHVRSLRGTRPEREAPQARETREAHAPAPAPSAPTSAPEGRSAAPPAAWAAEAAVDLAEEAPPAPRGHPWALGVATTIEVASAQGQPTGHVAFVWQFPFGPRLSLWARALWPLLGAQFQAEGEEVRLWTIAAGAGLQLALAPVAARLRPFVGLGVGPRLVLTDASGLEPQQSRVGFTPSASVGAQAGLRYTLAPLLHLYLELEAAQNVLLWDRGRARYEAEAANARALHASLGLLFEY